MDRVGVINTIKFLGVFTATHLSICLAISGFSAIIFGVLSIAISGINSKDSDPDQRTIFKTVGISLCCLGAILVIIAITVFVAAVKWGKKRINVLGGPNYPTLAAALPGAENMFQNPNYNQAMYLSNQYQPNYVHRPSISGSTPFMSPSAPLQSNMT